MSERLSVRAGRRRSPATPSCHASVRRAGRTGSERDVTPWRVSRTSPYSGRSERPRQRRWTVSSSTASAISVGSMRSSLVSTATVMPRDGTCQRSVRSRERGERPQSSPPRSLTNRCPSRVRSRCRGSTSPRPTWSSRRRPPAHDPSGEQRVAESRDLLGRRVHPRPTPIPTTRASRMAATASRA